MKFRLSLLVSALCVAHSSFAAQGDVPAASLMSAPSAFASPQQQANLLRNLANSHGLTAEHGYRLTQEHPGPAGSKVSRIAHTYKGVRVLHSESVVVHDKEGAIVRESLADLRHGLGQTGTGLRATAQEMDVSAKLSAQEAIAIAVQNNAPHGVHHTPPQAELIIFPLMESRRLPAAYHKAEHMLNALDMEDVVIGYQLAYQVKTRLMDGAQPVFHDSIINANTGEVLRKISAIHNVAGTAKTQYNGSVAINTTQNGASFTLLDTTRGVGGAFGGLAVLNANHAKERNIYTNSSNIWGDGLQYTGGDTNSANGQTPAAGAFYGMMINYDLMKNVLGWQSLDGRNTAFYAVAHSNDSPNANVYFEAGCNCVYMIDGPAGSPNYATVDVIGHELGHGVLNATAGLIYAGESGGLNESGADISGEMTEAYAKNGGSGAVLGSGNDWQIAKDAMPNGALRNMMKPSKDGASADVWSSTLKNIDVHYSSGPNNRMFYFLAQGSNATVGNDAYSSYLVANPKAMTGIGNDAAWRIWFNAMTTRFTSSTNYADARNKMVAAAQALYGVGSKQDIAVQRAYAAINVGADVNEAGILGFSTQPASQSVALGASVTFSVGVSGGTAPYSYKWFKNGVLVSSATSASYSFVTSSQDVGASFYAVVSDAKGAVITSNTAYLQLVAVENQIMQNPGFESGTANWAGTTSVIGNFTKEPPYEGSKSAWLGGKGVVSSQNLYQQIAIPANITSASLSFMLHIDSAETGSTAYDKLVVSVQNSSGTLLKSLATYSNANKAAGYTARTFDLSAYKGQTIRINFAASEDSSLQTSFSVDKVTLFVK